MASFGPYESSREISSSAGAEVLSARHSVESDGAEYAVKVYSFDALVGDNEGTRSDLDPILLELSRGATSRIEIQKKAAASSSCVAPVFASGRDSRGAWYVTLLYPRTLLKVVLGHVGLGAEGFHRIIRCVVDGALALKQTAGRSHGNLKLSNVLMSGALKIKSAEVVISDPLPGGADEVERYELEDLHCIGRLIYQLVFRREITNLDDWALLLPLTVSKEWTDVFGKNAGRWVELCNQLLDPALSLGTCDLERLAAEIRLLEPKPAISVPAMAAIVGVLCVCGVAAFVYVRMSSRCVLVLSVDPPGATILLDGNSQKAGRVPVSTGDHTVVAQYPNLDDVKTNITIGKGETTSVSLGMDYVAATVASVPPGAAVQAVVSINNKEYTATLPSSGATLFNPKAQVNLTFKLSGYQEGETNIVLNRQNARTIEVVCPLSPIPMVQPDQMLMTFTGLLRGAKLAIATDAGASVREETSVPGIMWEESLPVGRYRLKASFPHLNPVDFPFEVKPGMPETNDVPLQWAKMTFATDLGDVRIDGLWEEENPSTLIWAPGPVPLTIRKEGYIPTNITVNLAFRQRTFVAPELAPAVGFAEVTSDPDGAKVFDSTNGVWFAPVRVPLPPGPYSWRGLEDGLDDLTNSFRVKLGEPTHVRLNFSYGKLDLVVNPTNTTIKRDGVQLAPPYDVIQKSGQKSVYSFESPAYDSTTQEIVLSSNESKLVPVTLLPNIVSARFVTDPPGGRIFDENGGLIPDSGVHLRWGSHVLSAKYEGLEPITTNMWISVDDKANAMLALQFRYGTLIFTSSPPGALIFKEEKILRATPTNLYLLPAPESAYRMIFENQTNQIKTLRASVEQGSIKYLGAVFTSVYVLEDPLAGSSEYLELVKSH